MLLLPILLIAVIGVAAYKFMHRSVQPVARGAGAPAAVPVAGSSFWPTTLEGKLGVAAFVLAFLPWVLVNVIQVPYVGFVIQLVAVVLTSVARFVRHDRSTAVLIGFVVSTFATVAGVLFLLGEVVIGHD